MNRSDAQNEAGQEKSFPDGRTITGGFSFKRNRARPPTGPMLMAPDDSRPLSSRSIVPTIGLLPVVFSLLTAACSAGGEEPAGAWIHERTVEGDVTTIRTTAGSVWGGPATLVEEACIGPDIDDDRDLLGEVTGIAVRGDSILILDRTIHAVRVYDREGNHLADIGRRGQGPGELSMPAGVAIDPVTDRTIVRESARGSLQHFTPTGDYLESTYPGLQGGLSGFPLMIWITDEGRTFITQFGFRPLPESPLGFRSIIYLLEIDPAGAVVDTLYPPWNGEVPAIVTVTVNDEGDYKPLDVPFAPQEVWSLTREGALLYGYSREYRFEVRYPDGRVTVIERATDPVPVDPAERDWYEAAIFADFRRWRPGWVWNGPPIPRTKPYFSTLWPDRSGRIWVTRPGRGIRLEDGMEDPVDVRDFQEHPLWSSEYYFDIFEETTGRYLGEVEVPEGFQGNPEPHIDGDTVIAHVIGEDGAPLVKRFRLVPPPGDR